MEEASRTENGAGIPDNAAGPSGAQNTTTGGRSADGTGAKRQKEDAMPAVTGSGTGTLQAGETAGNLMVDKSDIWNKAMHRTENVRYTTTRHHNFKARVPMVDMPINGRAAATVNTSLVDIPYQHMAAAMKAEHWSHLEKKALYAVATNFGCRITGVHMADQKTTLSFTDTQIADTTPRAPSMLLINDKLGEVHGLRQHDDLKNGKTINDYWTREKGPNPHASASELLELEIVIPPHYSKDTLSYNNLKNEERISEINTWLCDEVPIESLIGLEVNHPTGIEAFSEIVYRGPDMSGVSQLKEQHRDYLSQVAFATKQLISRQGQPEMVAWANLMSMHTANWKTWPVNGTILHTGENTGVGHYNTLAIGVTPRYNGTTLIDTEFEIAVEYFVDIMYLPIPRAIGRGAVMEVWLPPQPAVEDKFLPWTTWQSRKEGYVSMVPILVPNTYYMPENHATHDGTWNMAKMLNNRSIYPGIWCDNTRLYPLKSLNMALRWKPDEPAFPEGSLSAVYWKNAEEFTTAMLATIEDEKSYDEAKAAIEQRLMNSDHIFAMAKKYWCENYMLKATDVEGVLNRFRRDALASWKDTGN